MQREDTDHLTPPMALALPAAASPLQPQPMPWWAAPAGLAFGFQLPILLLITWAGSNQGSDGLLTIRAIRFLSGPYLALAFALIGALALGGLIGSRLQLSRAPSDGGAGWDRAAAVIGTLALVAYVVWFRDYLFNPGLMWLILTGAHVPYRGEIVLTPGITSLVNMAPVFFSIFAYQRLVQRRPATRVLWALLAGLAGFTLFRVYAWSERLALIEASVPAALAAAAVLMRRGDVVSRGLRRLGPYAALPLVLLFFGIAEAGRSWASDTYHGKQDFWTFVLGRLTSYYYTALNNGAGLLATADWPTYTFEYVLAWLHNLPGVGSRFSALVGASDSLPDFFIRYGDEEFNSPSGLFTVVLDLGLAGGLAYMAALGLFSGLMFRAWRDGRLIGVLLYPMLFITALETFRYPYLGEPRAFVWLVGVGLAFAVRAWHRALRRRMEVST